MYMFRLMNCFLVLVLVLASSPDEVFGACLDECGNNSSQITTSQGKSFSLNTQHQSDDDSSSNNDCTCPIHSHHCCNHILIVGSSRSTEMVNKPEVLVVSLLYIAPFILEPSLDSLLRPPII